MPGSRGVDSVGWKRETGRGPMCQHQDGVMTLFYLLYRFTGSGV